MDHSIFYCISLINNYYPQNMIYHTYDIIISLINLISRVNIYVKHTYDLLKHLFFKTLPNISLGWFQKAMSEASRIYTYDDKNNLLDAFSRNSLINRSRTFSNTYNTEQGLDSIPRIAGCEHV